MSVALLGCGIASSIWYVGMNVIAAMRYPGYDVTSQTVSELSAIGAPTRPLWDLMGIVYTLLVVAFGFGIWRAARQSLQLRVVAAAMMAYGSLGFYWPPMHMRGTAFNLYDTLHIAFAMVAVVLMALAMLYGASAFGKWFRLYSYATLATMLGFGALTGVSAPGIAQNLPTPMVGVWERINIGVFLLWTIILSVLLIRQPSAIDRVAS